MDVEAPQSCETSRLTDGSQVVSLMFWPPFTPFTHFCQRLNQTLREIVQLKGLSQLRNSVTSMGIKPMTFQLIAQCLDQLHYHVPLLVYHLFLKGKYKSFAHQIKINVVTFFKRVRICKLRNNETDYLTSHKR